jgi:hypothetical protein
MPDKLAAIVEVHIGAEGRGNRENAPVSFPVACHPVGAYRHAEAPALIKATGAHLYTYSAQGQCVICDCDVWIGPRSLKKVVRGEAAPVCWDCVWDRMAILAARGDRPLVVANLGNPE